MQRMSEYVDFNDFPNDLLKQIPLSLRTNKSEYLFKELPIEIQYLIEKYYEEKVPEISYNNLIDAEFSISPYSDFKIIDNKRVLIGNYLKNYLNIRIGSYPFDVDFGCALKDQLHTLDTSLRNTLVSNEIYTVASVISGDCNIGINVEKFEIIPYQDYDKVEYYAKIILNVDNDEEVEITV